LTDAKSEARENESLRSLKSYLEAEGYTDIKQMPRVVRGVTGQNSIPTQQEWDAVVHCKDIQGNWFLFFSESNHKMTSQFLEEVSDRLEILQQLVKTTLANGYRDLAYSDIKVVVSATNFSEELIAEAAGRGFLVRSPSGSRGATQS